MKHPWFTTGLLLGFFLASQLLGLALVSMIMPVEYDIEGNAHVGAPNTAVGPPPETSPTGGLFILLLGVLIGTVLILLIIKLRRFGLWKLWFFLAATMTMSISFGALFGDSQYTLATSIAFLLAAWKVFKPNPYVHNLTELFIYPGIAILFYHILSIPTTLIMLALISIYDVIAVFRSKHMVTMAKFQTESRMFAGLAIPRSFAKTTATNSTIQKTNTTTEIKKTPDKNTIQNKEKRKPESGTAILGGGDIAFPLLFASVVLKDLVSSGIVKSTALLLTSIIPLTTMCMLLMLFVVAKEGKYYPAMPAVSAGAIFGWLIILIVA